jgi:hypothetical protein
MEEAPKFKNPHRLSAKSVLIDNFGTASLESPEVRRALLDSVQPACCDEGCEVEPDGRCEHGCPSVSLALGII